MRAIKAKHVKVGDIIEVAHGEAVVQDVELLVGDRYRIVAEVVNPVVVLNRHATGEVNLVRRPE